MQRITAAELRKTAARRKGVKRVKNARRCIVDGLSFDSALESRWWMNLSMLERDGAISNLRRQVKIPLIGRDGPILTPTGRAMIYVADFAWVERGEQMFGDAKGFPTEVYKMKRAILGAQGVSVKELR